MSQPRPVITIEGERVALGPMRRDLIPLCHAWINDLTTMRFLRMSPTSLEEEVAWYDQMVKETRTGRFTSPSMSYQITARSGTATCTTSTVNIVPPNSVS